MRKNFKIIFATFSPWEKNRRSPTNGMVEPMISFFGPRTDKFVLIDQPHPGSDRVIPIIETYKFGRPKKVTRSSLLVSWLYPLLTFRNTLHTSIVFKLRDFLSVLDFATKDKDHFDLFIGLESINTLAGLLLKKFGLVKKVVYYVTDFSLHRYENLFLNKLFLSLDRLAFKHADFVWDISREIMPARIAAGMEQLTDKTPLFVPGALSQNQIKAMVPAKKIPQSIVYAGVLRKENGADLAIYALKKVLRQVPEAKLHIFTSGQATETQALRDLTDKLGIHSRVFFHGLIENQTELITDLAQFCIGVAPYRSFPDSPRWWADAKRVRLYLAAGLPVVTTKVPPIAKELKEKQSGLVVKDNANQIANAIVSLLKNKSLYRKMKQRASLQARENSWDKVYSKTLKSMGVAL